VWTLCFLFVTVSDCAGLYCAFFSSFMIFRYHITLNIIHTFFTFFFLKNWGVSYIWRIIHQFSNCPRGSLEKCKHIWSESSSHSNCKSTPTFQFSHCLTFLSFRYVQFSISFYPWKIILHIVVCRTIAKWWLCKQWPLLGNACNVHTCDNRRAVFSVGPCRGVIRGTKFRV
jgi:hypothetical protein